MAFSKIAGLRGQPGHPVLLDEALQAAADDEVAA